MDRKINKNMTAGLLIHFVNNYYDDESDNFFLDDFLNDFFYKNETVKKKIEPLLISTNFDGDELLKIYIEEGNEREMQEKTGENDVKDIKNSDGNFENSTINKQKEGGKVEELKQALHDVLGADATITVKTEEPIANKIELKDGSTKIGFNCKMVVDGVELTASFTITKKAILPLFGNKEELSLQVKNEVKGFFDILKNTTEKHLKNM
jgi:hypothetical protein